MSDKPISIDTRNAEVISKLIKYKINIVNDISSLQDDELLDIVKENNLTISLMHMQGTPENMQDNPVYENVVDEIFIYLEEKINMC